MRFPPPFLFSFFLSLEVLTKGGNEVREEVGEMGIFTHGKLSAYCVSGLVLGRACIPTGRGEINKNLKKYKISPAGP